jgi:hypothetical protein
MLCGGYCRHGLEPGELGHGNVRFYELQRDIFERQIKFGDVLTVALLGWGILEVGQLVQPP